MAGALEGDSLQPPGEGLEQVEVIVGTYEEFVLGYKLQRDKENERYSLSMSFTNHSQSRSIRCVSTLGRYLAAGSADESINLINMEARVEHGSLQEQNGTITCLASHSDAYLFSGCDDGSICIWKKGSWLCEKTLKGHLGGVVDVAVHPSGKLALSIGKDKALKTWNLVKGRCGYVTNLKAVGDAVRWSPEGNYYAVSVANRVDVYKVESAKVVYSVAVGHRITCLCFIDESTLVIAGDKDSAEVHQINGEGSGSGGSGRKLCEWSCHKNRVKAVSFLEELGILFTASNDGFIKCWRFKKDNYAKAPKLLTELDTTCRITCMAVWVKEASTEEDGGDAEEEEEEMEVEGEEGSGEEMDDEEEDDDSSEVDEEEEEEPAPPPVLAKKRRKLDKSDIPDKPIKAKMDKVKLVQVKSARDDKAKATKISNQKSSRKQRK